jgi:8-amino-7-oxononanoate synthase
MVYRHSDMTHLEKLLASVPLEAGKLIITDGVFSMTGQIAPYDQIHELAKKYNARTYIDDAHGLGVVGPGGKGTAAIWGLKSDILMGTFSKSLASQGGFICASSDIVDWMVHKARTFMFSAALAPASAAAAMKALEIVEQEPERVALVLDNAKFLKTAFDDLGLNTLGTETCVIPIFVGDDQTALGVCEKLLSLGVFTTPVVYPAVRKGRALIRCSVMATHTKEDLSRAIEGFRAVAPAILAANKNPNLKALHDGMTGKITFREDDPTASLVQ